MAKNKKKRPGRQVRFNQGVLVDEEIDLAARQEIEENLPELLEIFEDIKDDASDDLGFDVESEFPGIDKTIMRIVREEL